jgi:predicted neuraminidase
MPVILKTIGFFSFSLLLAVVAVWQNTTGELTWQLDTKEGLQKPDDRPVFTRSFIFEQGPTASVHASAIVFLPQQKQLLSVWYGGSREGSSDVAIYFSRKPAEAAGWSKPEVLIDRARAAQELGRHIKKLGNPVLLSDGKGKVWMFFVSTSIGGWSTSAVNLIISQDGGHSWGKAKRLVTTPFINISTLVKGRPFFYQDGSIGLPAYHELAGKFAELIRVTQDGSVVSKVRITDGRYSIQPSIVALAKDDLLALMRSTDQTREIVRAYGKQGGRVWTKSDYTGLANPDAAISAAGGDRLTVMAYNNLKHDRNLLALATSTDRGQSWEKRYQLESLETDKAGKKSEFSYPYMIKTKEGDFHLVYTWQRKRIAYVHFNQAWLEQQP